MPVSWYFTDLNSRLRLARFCSSFHLLFVALRWIKVVALTVEHQNSADQGRQRHKGLFSADQTGAAKMLLLRKMRSIRAAANEQVKVQWRAGLTYPSPFPSIALSKAVILKSPHVAACLYNSPSVGLVQTTEPSGFHCAGVIQRLTAVKGLGSS